MGTVLDPKGRRHQAATLSPAVNVAQLLAVGFVFLFQVLTASVHLSYFFMNQVNVVKLNSIFVLQLPPMFHERCGRNNRATSTLVGWVIS